MTVTPFHNYNSPAVAFDLLRKLQGVFRPGRYAGFGTILDQGTTAGNINIAVSNTVDGYTDISSIASLTTDSGKVITPQGAILLVNDPQTETLSIATTSGNPRIDLIVMTHEWQEVVGGQAATLSVIQGTAAATPLVPTTTSTYQTIIGQVYVPANATSFADLTYTKAGTPLPGVGTPDYNQLLTELLHIDEQIEVSAVKGMGHLDGTPPGLSTKIGGLDSHVSLNNAEFQILKNPWGQVLIQGRIAVSGNVAVSTTFATLTPDFRAWPASGNTVIPFRLKYGTAATEPQHGVILADGSWQMKENGLQSGTYNVEPIFYQSVNTTLSDWTRTIYNSNNTPTYPNSPLTP